MLWLSGLDDVQGKDVASLGPHCMAIAKLSDDLRMLRGHIVHLRAVVFKVVQVFVALDIAVILPRTADHRLLAVEVPEDMRMTLPGLACPELRDARDGARRVAAVVEVS